MIDTSQDFLSHTALGRRSWPCVILPQKIYSSQKNYSNPSKNYYGICLIRFEVKVQWQPFLTTENHNIIDELVLINYKNCVFFWLDGELWERYSLKLDEVL